MRRPRRGSLLVFPFAAGAILAASGSRVEAQPYLRGTVVSALDGRPLPGVLLELRDSAAVGRATTLTSAAGGFVLRTSGPGEYRIAARRLGFHSQVLGPIRVVADTTLTLEMAAIPQLLPAVTTVDRSACRARPDAATATSVLWESAQTALRASAVTLRDGGFVFDFASQQRMYAVEPTRLEEVSVVFSRVRDVKPWVALPVADLARLGFVHVTKEKSLVFAAPDIEMVTSPVFAARHCYAVREDADRPEVIGLEFRPHADTRVSDVRGTLWLTRDSLLLESMEFAFTGIHFVGHDSLAGGRIAFTRLEDGGWVPTEWMVRSPVPPTSFVNSVARRARRDIAAGLDVSLQPSDPRWESRRILVTGGNVLTLRRGADSSVAWRMLPGEIDASVRWRRGDRGPATGVPVLLRGLDARATVDSSGHASFAAVPPGEYILDTTTELQELLNLPREVRTVRVRSGQVTRVRLTAFPSPNAINTVCAFNGDNAVLAGVVTRDAKEVLWARISVARIRRDGEREVLETVRTAWSGTGGRFHACRIPRGETVAVTARYEDGLMVRQDVAIPSLDGSAGPIHHVRVDFTAPPRQRDPVRAASASAPGAQRQ